MAKRGHGEGTIYKRKDGRWEAKASIGYDPATGKLKRLTRYFQTRREAQEWLAQVQHEKATGTFVEPHKLTVGEWLDRWLHDYMKPHLKPTTWAGYRTLIERHLKPAIGSIPLHKLQTGDLQRLYKEKLENGRVDGKGSLSSHYVRYMQAIMHEALKQAVEEGLVYRNVAEAVKLPSREKREIRPLTVEEMERFIAAAKGHRLYAAFLLELGTGLRRGELLALRWQDVDLKRGLLTVKRSLARVSVEGEGKRTQLAFLNPKTRAGQRVVPIPEEVLKELKAHKARQNEERLFFGGEYENNDLVFCTETGRPIDPRNFTRAFEGLLKKAGLPKVRFHDLRHTYATRLLELNEHPKIVQELLGHAKITTTIDTYSHVIPDLKERAAAKLNELFRAKKKTSPTTGREQ